MRLACENFSIWEGFKKEKLTITTIIITSYNILGGWGVGVGLSTDFFPKVPQIWSSFRKTFYF